MERATGGRDLTFGGWVQHRIHRGDKHIHNGDDVDLDVDQFHDFDQHHQHFHDNYHDNRIHDNRARAHF